MLFYYHKEYKFRCWSCIQGYQAMIQEGIHEFIENFKYFTAILALCLNSPTPK